MATRAIQNYTVGFLVCILLTFLSVEFIHRRYTVPTQIWCYWNSDIPMSVQKILAKNKQLLKGWNYTVLTDQTLSEFLDVSQFPAEVSKLSAPHKADYIRLALLKQYGGCWLDASIVIHSPGALESIRQVSQRSHSALTAFSLGEPQYTYIENWFLMAPKDSPVIKRWFQEYEKAVRMGFKEYKKEVFEKGFHINERIYKRDDGNVYLTQHACLQVVRQTMDQFPVSVLLYKAEDSMFKLHEECKWNADCIKEKMKKDPTVQEIPFIKLRGNDRD